LFVCVVEVPLARFNGGKTTYEFTGEETVQIIQNSDSDDKRFATLQVVTRAVPKGGAQPPMTIVFRVRDYE